MKTQETAASAGVSTPTVSRLFSHHPNIREEVREHVLAVARKHNYHPRLSAKPKNIVIIRPYEQICPAAEFVEIETLQKAVHRKVAELTRNEAAYLCNSCSTAIYLAAAAFVEKHCSRNFNLLSHEEIAQYEVVALKTVLAEADLIPILIFDEIDANIGGETATKVAGEIAVLAANKQILCISHLPQIASRANIHFNVSKESKGEATHTHIRQLDHAGRVKEIARMLGGGAEAAKLAAGMLSGSGDLSKTK